MTNLTLSVDDALLQRAREVAVQERTSVNAVVRDFLVHYADARTQRLRALDTLDAIAERNPSRSKANWSRESLHER